MRDLPLFRHEPSEPASLDAANDALDRIERDVAAVIEAGGEMALRARLSRLLGAGLASRGPVASPPAASVGRRSKRQRGQEAAG